MAADLHREETLGKTYDLKLLGRLWRYVLPYRRPFALSFLLLPIISGFSLSRPYIMKIAIDRYIATADTAGLGLMGALFSLCLVGELVCSYLQHCVTAQVAQSSLADLRAGLFSHIQKLPMSYFDRRPIGRLVTRVTTDTEAINEMFSSGAMTMITDSLTIVGILVIMFMIHPGLTLVSLALMPVLILALNFFRVRGRRTYRLIRERIARINSYLQEAISGMTTIQLFTQEKRTAGEFSELNRAHREARHRSNIYEATLYSVVEAVNAISIALILWYGGGWIFQGVLTFGVLVAFIEYLHKLFVPLRDFGSKYTAVQAALSSTERIFQLLDTPTQGVGLPGRLPVQAQNGAVEFRDVWFSYKDEPVLRGISLSVEPGARIAVVGRTGSGKTTLVRLLNRLYELERGTIAVDGLDVRDWDLASLRRNIGVVSQDVFLFSGDVEKNLRLNRTDCGRDELEKMARRVNAHEFISGLPDGYGERLRERGANLSSGQRQLLALARVLLVRPKILILDEATSNIDPESEALIQAGLQKIMEGRTCIIIAHRLSTIQAVDRIVVMHKGKIREMGSHEELMHQRGIYYRLYQLHYRRGLASPFPRANDPSPRYR